MAGVYIYTLWPTNLLVRDIIHEWTGPLCGFKIFLVSTNKHFTQGSVHSWITSHTKRFLGDYICSAIIKVGMVLNFQQEMFGNGITNIINTQIVKILYFQITRVLQDLTPEIMPQYHHVQLYSIQCAQTWWCYNYKYIGFQCTENFTRVYLTGTIHREKVNVNILCDWKPSP